MTTEMNPIPSPEENKRSEDVYREGWQRLSDYLTKLRELAEKAQVQDSIILKEEK